MIDVKTAVQNAKKELLIFFLDEDIQGIELEEVEYDDGKSVWLITLGFYKKNSNPNKKISTMIQISNTHERKYKTFRVRASDGEVLSMKICNVH